MGLLYIGYYVAFLLPGFFIFLGVHKVLDNYNIIYLLTILLYYYIIYYLNTFPKRFLIVSCVLQKIRKFLVIPPLTFLVIVTYGLVLESIYDYRPSRIPEVFRLSEKGGANKSDFARLRAGYWMDMFVKITGLLVYLFMLFFYYREIGPDSTPVPSRYRQAYHAASQGACGQQGMMVGSPGSHSVITGGGGGGRFGPGPGSIIGNPHDQGPQQISQGGSSMGPRTFHPLSVMGNDTTSSSSHLVQNTFIPPFNMPNQSGSSGGGRGDGANESGGGGGGSVPRSNAHFIRSANPILDLASFSNLTLEQQRELAMLQAHPLLSQQHSQQQIHPQHLQQLLSSQDPRLLEFLQAQAQAAAAQSKNKNLY